MAERRIVRPVRGDDYEAVSEVYETSAFAELKHRLSSTGRPPGTTYHVVDSDGEIATVFGLTELGRLRPGTPPRLLLHEFKLGARFRGTDVLEDVLEWLVAYKGAGRDVEVVVFAPANRLPESFARRGFEPFLDVLKWETV
ncbi:hypothetical protein [Nocardiopsis listeri]|uniref:hypothetical protein n=1 Tax=Nocardiopsis listeri TaxID=53440 RepID=UPI0008375BC6|nr:hypothetical protein [Nocardiopsis listeri]